MAAKLNGQTTYQVNGRTLQKINGHYFDIKANDTLLVDMQHITVKLDNVEETIALNQLINEYPIELKTKTKNDYYVFKLIPEADLIQVIHDIYQNRYVKRIYLNYLGFYFDEKPFPNDPGGPNAPLNQENCWYFGHNGLPEEQYLNLGAAWGLTSGNENIMVGIIDTGCDWTQADFPEDNHIGYNFENGNTNTNPDPVWLDTHGTIMTSIIASKINNNTDIFGIAGAWYNGQQSENTGVKPVMFVNAGEWYWNGAEWIHFWSTSTLPGIIEMAADLNIRIINMSFGAWNLPPEEMEPITDAIDYAIKTADAVFVASAGNIQSPGSVSNQVAFPASYEPVIAVGGADNAYNLYVQAGGHMGSCHGENLDVIAPYRVFGNQGCTSYGIDPTHKVDQFNGTSNSAAIVSGIIGLMLSANPCLTSEEIKEILIASCYKSPAYTYQNGWNEYVGYGFVNAKTAVELSLTPVASNIAGNITWNKNRNSGDIIINPQSSLTLENMELYMMDSTGITIMPGGKLFVKNSIITTSCNTTTHRWKGITVYGNRFQSYQSPTYHGLASFTNSTVENAEKAIDVPMTTQYAGGIVWATGSHFVNNDIALDFGGYNYYSLSHFKQCTFEANQNFTGNYTNSNVMVKLSSMKGINFYSCIFNNSKTTTPTGVAIRTQGSSYTITGTCNSSQNPCPPQNIETGRIANFDRGIYTVYSNYSTRTKVEYTDFVGNNRGAYFSLNGYFDVLNCDFQVPEHVPNGVDTYGLYLESCTGYHVENNLFESQLPNSTGQIGLYIYNSGTSQNYIYRNTFTKLSRAAVADGNNRASGGATGLCFKCNDFYSNGTDIDVLGTSTPYSGISRYQGFPSDGNPNTQKDTLAAANTFSQNVNYNIRNLSGNYTEYYYHQNNNAPPYKIIPNPVLNMTTIQNSSTTYDRINICKSWIPTGSPIPIETLITQKEEAETGSETTGLQLQVLVDGGSTANLTFDILGSLPSEALQLRNELLAKSPYLSDTVMKTAILKEDVLPNALVRDVLVENPQAAKSTEIMEMLDMRWEPMPSYMQEEIAAGATVIGGREQLEARLAAYQQLDGMLFNRIVNTYLSDTINPDAITELQTFLQNENTAQAGFLLADLHLQQGHYPAANNAISTMQSDLTLDAGQSELAADYLTLIGIMQTLQADSIQPYSLDSLHAEPLFNLYQSGENAACVMARDMLIASGLLNYQEPIHDVPDSLKSAVMPLPEIKTDNKKENNSGMLNVFPNPANNYTIAEYALPQEGNYSLVITNALGIKVKQIDLTLIKDQVTIDLLEYKPGYYLVCVQKNGKTIVRKSLNIVR